MRYRPSIPAFLALPVESLVRSAAGTTRSHKNKCPCVRSTSRGGEPCPSTGESDSSPFGELGETPTVDTVRGGLPLSFASPKETATIAAIRRVALFFPCFVPGILGVTWDLRMATQGALPWPQLIAKAVCWSPNWKSGRHNDVRRFDTTSLRRPGKTFEPIQVGPRDVIKLFSKIFQHELQ